MSTKHKKTASHVRGGILLDIPSYKLSHIGPFEYLGEFLPCMIIDGHNVRVDVVGTENQLYVWLPDEKRWDIVAKTTVNFRLSVVASMLLDYHYMQSLTESV